MEYDLTIQLLIECLKQVTSGDLGTFIGNPAVEFTRKAKAGVYDEMSDEEYMSLLHKIEKLSTHWHRQMRRPVGDVLLSILGRITIPKTDQADIVERLLTWYDWGEGEQDVSNQTDAREIAKDIFESASAPRTPAEIRDSVAESVIGQPEAVKAAAMITYNHLSGRRTNAVFAGPSGCGKSETWRCLSKEYPGLIRIIDFSRMSADGWKGSFHLKDIFDGVNLDNINNQDKPDRPGLIVVLDEADKILCERAVGASGTDYNAMIQNSLLKMMDGDVIEFGGQDGPPLKVDCSRISVVMLGAFETLLEGKAAGAKHISGFGGTPDAGTAVRHQNISYNDLISAGMRREVAGRVTKIVVLNPLAVGEYEAILRGPVLSGLRESVGRGISIDDASIRELSEQAIQSRLGVRWMRSQLLNAIDDAIFDAPGAEHFSFAMRDGTLLCRAENRREKGLAEPCRHVPGNEPGAGDAPRPAAASVPDEELPF